MICFKPRFLNLSMERTHEYNVGITWTGNSGAGTKDYRSYERSHSIHIHGKEVINGSSDAAFRGDKTKHTPEDLFVASISACHMLWYLHLCSEAGVVVTDYVDHATGTMTETADGGGHFTEVTLNPVVTVKEISMTGKANELHAKANELCFIARSLNFQVKHEPNIVVK